MVRLQAIWFGTLAATILSFISSNTSATAQTIYPFEATYNSENTLTPIVDNISKVTITAESTDAPYGLTKFVNTNYGQFDSSTGTIIFSPDAAEFGLENLPSGGVTFFGNGSDRLFGNITGTAALDFQNLVGTATGAFNITGGSGRFTGATGTFTFLENDTLNPDPTAPFKSQAFLSGSFQTPRQVPESSNTTTLVGFSLIAISLLIRRRAIKQSIVKN